MIVRASHHQPLARAATAVALLLFGFGLGGCAEMGEGMSSAFVDPAKYDLYDCKQLETERKGQASRQAELQGLMAKADTGVAGPLVGELAYRNDYISIRAQAKLADEVWKRNKCQPTPAVAGAPAAPPAAPATDKAGHLHMRSGNAVY